MPGNLHQITGRYVENQSYTIQIIQNSLIETLQGFVTYLLSINRWWVLKICLKIKFVSRLIQPYIWDGILNISNSKIQYNKVILKTMLCRILEQLCQAGYRILNYLSFWIFGTSAHLKRKTLDTIIWTNLVYFTDLRSI